MLEYRTATRGAEKSDYPRLFCCWGLHNLNGQDTSAERDARGWRPTTPSRQHAA